MRSRKFCVVRTMCAKVDLCSEGGSEKLLDFRVSLSVLNSYVDYQGSFWERRGRQKL